MSLLKFVTRLVLPAVLVALAVCAFGATSAFANEPWLKVCKLVPSGLKGLWNSNTCEGTNVATGAWAWAWPLNFGQSTDYCVLGGKEYTESLCETASSSCPFLVHTTNEQFPRIYALLLLSQLRSVVAGTTTLIHCEHGSSEGQPLTHILTSGAAIEYTSCEVTKPATAGELCTVTNAGGTAATIRTEPLIDQGEGMESKFTPETGTVFVELEFKNKGSEPCVLKNGTKAKITGNQKCVWETAIETPALEHLQECKTTGSSLKLGEEKATYEGTTHFTVLGDLWWKIRLT